MPVRDLLNAASGTGGATDPYFYDVSLLLNGDGTNGAQNNTFLDSSTNNFSITRNGNTTQGSFSPYGNLWSNYFNGTNAYLTPSSYSLSIGTSADFTLEAWIFVTTTPSGFSTPILSSSTSGAVYFGNTSSGFGLRNIAGSNLIYASFTTINQWVHVAVTRASGTLRLFFNGALQSTVTGNTTAFTSGVPIIGNDPGQSFFPGYISNLRIVNGTAVYTSAFTPSTTPLTAVTNTQLLTCQSNRFIDNSSNAYALTISGTPSVQRFSPFNPTAPYSTTTIGGSGYFDGSSAYLSNGSAGTAFIPTSGFTLECWFNASVSAATNYDLFAVGGSTWSWSSTGIMFALFNASGTLYFQWYTGGSSQTQITTTFPTTNSWHHIAIGYNGTTTRMWIDGVSVGTSTTGYTIPTSPVNFSIGGQTTVNPGSYWNGYVSDCRFVKGTDVYGVGNSTITVPTTPLTAISGTSLLTSMTNAGIPDLAMQNDLQTVGSAQVSTSVKKYGTGSIYFATSGAYLYTKTIPSISLGNTWTVEYWYQTSTTPTYHNITLNNAASGGGNYWMGPSTTAFTVSFNGTNKDFSFTPTYNTWNYYAIVCLNGTVSVYVDGNMIGSPQTGGGAFSIDSINGYPLNLWVGYIDDLRITNGYARYTSNFTPPTSALPTY